MTTEPRQLLLLGATFNTSNMGVGALTDGSLRVLAERYPAARVSFLDYGASGATIDIEVAGKHHTVDLINLRFSWRLYLPNNVLWVLARAIGGGLVAKHRRVSCGTSNRWLRAINEADMAFAISGGDSFSDIYGLGRLIYVSLPQIIVIVMGKPLALLPQTIGPFEGRLSRYIARFILNRARRIYARDQESLRVVARLIGPEAAADKTEFCFDLGFLIEPRRPVAFEPWFAPKGERKRLLVGLNVSGLLMIGGYNHRNTFGLLLDYPSFIESLIRSLIDKHDADVLLIPHVFGVDDESDVVAIATIGKTLRGAFPERLFAVSGEYDQNEIKYVIGQCDVLIGSRMHACIAALSQSIPAVGIAYSDKFRGVYESLGLEELVADPRMSNEADMLDRIDGIIRVRAHVAARLSTLIPTVRASILSRIRMN